MFLSFTKSVRQHALFLSFQERVRQYATFLSFNQRIWQQAILLSFQKCIRQQAMFLSLKSAFISLIWRAQSGSTSVFLSFSVLSTTCLSKRISAQWKCLSFSHFWVLSTKQSKWEKGRSWPWMLPTVYKTRALDCQVSFEKEPYESRAFFCKRDLTI